MSRLFIAVWPPVDVIDVLSRLPRTDEPGVRWTTEDQWHVTLRFFGKVDESAAIVALETVRAAPATATLGPQITRLSDSVIVAPVGGLAEIAGAIREVTAELGEPVDPRPFLGHITVARQRNGDRCGLDGCAVDGQFRVDELALVRSDLHSTGARYSTVARHPLVKE